MSLLGERMARLETLMEVQVTTTDEIKKDVKSLLAAKWKADGKALGIAAVVASLVTVAGWFIPFLK